MALTARYPLVLVPLVALLPAGCATERDTAGLEPEPPNTDPVVFTDDFSEGTEFQAFLGSYLDALSIDASEKYSGTSSLKITVPLGTWAGGAFPTNRARDLSGYDALTFWAKASQPTTLDIAGLGNDNTGTSKYEASWSGIPLTTSWAKYLVPIPLPAKLRAEDGLFFFADADTTATEDYSIWFDEILFERPSTIADPRPRMNAQTIETFAGVELQIGGISTTFVVSGIDQIIRHSPGYFTFMSSDESVATVSREGLVRAVGSGSAAITAKLGEVAVPDTVKFEVAVPDPTGPAPIPTHPQTNVIAIYSDAYSTVAVREWSTSWDTAEVFDLQIAGDHVKVFDFDDVLAPNEPFAGIDFQDDLIDAEAAGMTHIHLDVWIPGAFYMRVKLVDFGSDGVYTDGSVTACGAAPQDEKDISQHAAARTIDDPDITGAWYQLDIPLVDFEGPDFGGQCLWSRAHLAQLILAVPNGVETAYVDNIYFYK
jgi:hypothetical protein